MTWADQVNPKARTEPKMVLGERVSVQIERSRSLTSSCDNIKVRREPNIKRSHKSIRVKGDTIYSISPENIMVKLH